MIVLEEGWDLDTADVIEWCDFHKAGGTPGFDCWGAGLDGQDSCRMVRRPLLKRRTLLKPEHAAD